jgi:hypothetical protein
MSLNFLQPARIHSKNLKTSRVGVAQPRGKSMLKLPTTTDESNDLDEEVHFNFDLREQFGSWLQERLNPKSDTEIKFAITEKLIQKQTELHAMEESPFYWVATENFEKIKEKLEQCRHQEVDGDKRFILKVNGESTQKTKANAPSCNRLLFICLCYFIINLSPTERLRWCDYYSPSFFVGEV